MLATEQHSEKWQTIPFGYLFLLFCSALGQFTIHWHRIGIHCVWLARRDLVTPNATYLNARNIPYRLQCFAYSTIADTAGIVSRHTHTHTDFENTRNTNQILIPRQPTKLNIVIA